MSVYYRYVIMKLFASYTVIASQSFGSYNKAIVNQRRISFYFHFIAIL